MPSGAAYAFAFLCKSSEKSLMFKIAILYYLIYYLFY